MESTIKIKGQEYAIRVSWKVLKRFCNKTGKKMQELDDLSPMDFEEILYQAIMLNNPGATITREQLEDWLDEDMSRLYEISSIIERDLQPAPDPEGEVKKQMDQ